jgi:hypothetical protein
MDPLSHRQLVDPNTFRIIIAQIWAYPGAIKSTRPSFGLSAAVLPTRLRIQSSLMRPATS